MKNDTRQLNIVIEAGRFAEKVIRPKAGQFDREERYPKEIIDRLAERRFLLASLPKANGGLGLDPLYYGFFTEAIGKACCATRGLITVQSSLIGETLLRWGTKEQKMNWLSAIADGQKIGAFALTEPHFGSNARGVQTTYERSGKEFVIKGQKKWISFAEIADFFIERDPSLRTKDLLAELIRINAYLEQPKILPEHVFMRYMTFIKGLIDRI